MVIYSPLLQLLLEGEFGSGNRPFPSNVNIPVCYLALKYTAYNTNTPERIESRNHYAIL